MKVMRGGRQRGTDAISPTLRSLPVIVAPAVGAKPAAVKELKDQNIWLLGLRA
jgi:hypothetical protein